MRSYLVFLLVSLVVELELVSNYGGVVSALVEVVMVSSISS